MKKLFITFTLLLSLFVITSCDQGVTDPDTLFGSIKGTVTYSNAEDNSNIYLTVEQISTNRKIVSREAETDAETPESIIYTKADADGTYTFNDLPVGTYKVYASSETCAEKAVSVEVQVAANTITIPDDLTLTATGTVSGKITKDSSEKDNAGIIVYLAGTSYISITDDDGSFTISDVPAGTEYTIRIIIGNDEFEWDKVTAVAFEDTAAGTKDILSSDLTIVKDGKDGADGKDGTTIVYLGSFASASEITNPQNMNIYYNTTDGCSYIYSNNKWNLLAAKGAAGLSGTSVYSLQLVLMGGNHDENITLPICYTPGNILVLPEVTKTGKDFTGWFNDAESMEPSEYVRYDSNSNTYTLNTPATLAEPITLYAGFGKVFTTWEDFKQYKTDNPSNQSELIFFSGNIEVTSNISLAKDFNEIVHLRGINNANLKLKCDWEILKYANECTISNITFDGNNQYSTTVYQSGAITSKTIIKNCTFKNMVYNGNDCGLIAIFVTAASYIFNIEKCTFENNRTISTIIYIPTSSENNVNYKIKNCMFKDNSYTGITYEKITTSWINKVVTIMAKNPVIENCSFVNNQNFAADLMTSTPIIKGTTNLSKIYFNVQQNSQIQLDNASITNKIDIYTDIKENTELELLKPLICNKDGSTLSQQQTNMLNFYYDKNSDGLYNIIDKSVLTNLINAELTFNVKFPKNSDFNYKYDGLDITYYDSDLGYEVNTVNGKQLWTTYTYKLNTNFKLKNLKFYGDVNMDYYTTQYKDFYVNFNLINLEDELTNNNLQKVKKNALLYATDTSGNIYISCYEFEFTASEVLSCTKTNNIFPTSLNDCSEVKYYYTKPVNSGTKTTTYDNSSSPLVITEKKGNEITIKCTAKSNNLNLTFENTITYTVGSANYQTVDVDLLWKTTN